MHPNGPPNDTKSHLLQALLGGLGAVNPLAGNVGWGAAEMWQRNAARPPSSGRGDDRKIDDFLRKLPDKQK
jgi:hypothetical protein